MGKRIGKKVMCVCVWVCLLGRATGVPRERRKTGEL